MEYLWLLVVLTTMVVYPVVLIRSALKGKPWAIETLKAMRYVGGDMMTTSAWRALPPEPEPPAAESPALDSTQEAEPKPGRLVA